MPNQLRAGAVWAQKQRHAHHTEQIIFNGVPLLATTPETDTEVERNGVKLATKFYKFIVRNSDLVLYNLVIKRGLLITWGSQSFEITNEGGHTHYPNDPFDLDIVIMTVKR